MRCMRLFTIAFPLICKQCCSNADKQVNSIFCLVLFCICILGLFVIVPNGDRFKWLLLVVDPHLIMVVPQMVVVTSARLLGF